MGRRPNVVLIVADTLREDHSGALDALLSMGFRKYRGVAPAPWTLPSHVSMFTGLYPSMHGAHEAYGVGALELAALSREAMRASGGGILGDLARDGYETHMYSANTIFVTPRYGFVPFDEVLLVPYFAPTALSSEGELEDFLSYASPSPRSVARLLGRGQGAFNLGTGRPTSLLRSWARWGTSPGSRVDPSITGEFRPGGNRHDSARIERHRATRAGESPDRPAR
ncbi:MAG: hypothetical protein RXO54_05620 [Acidilobus sp.]|jgi:hypothetical protein